MKDKKRIESGVASNTKTTTKNYKTSNGSVSQTEVTDKDTSNTQVSHNNQIRVDKESAPLVTVKILDDIRKFLNFSNKTNEKILAQLIENGFYLNQMAKKLEVFDDEQLIEYFNSKNINLKKKS